MTKPSPNPRLLFAWSGLVMVLFLVERAGFYGWAFFHQQSKILCAIGVIAFQIVLAVSFFSRAGRHGWTRLSQASGRMKLRIAFLAAVLSLVYLAFVHTFADFHELTIELFWLPGFWTILILIARPSARALGASIAIALVPQVLIFAEVVLLLIGSVFPTKHLDYPDLYGALGPGGFLKPNIDAQVIGERGLVHWKTNSAGFRNDSEISPLPDPKQYRILFAGDSFVAGYRVDQKQSVGYRLEKILKDDLPKTGEAFDPKVLVSCLEDPQTASQWLDPNGTRWRPNMFIYGVTIANDAPQVYMRVEKDYDRYILPPDAFDRVAPGVKQLRRYKIAFFRFSQIGRRLDRVIDNFHPVAMTSQFNDTIGRVHVFDFYHGLGQFYAPGLPEVDRAFADLNRALERMRDTCAKNGIEFRVAIFPQRYQVDNVNWRATVRQYGLNPSRFDLMQPNRRIADFCAKNEIPCLDLTPAFAQVSPNQNLFMPMGDMHFSAAGDDLAARRIAGWRMKDRIRPSGPFRPS